VAAAALLAVPAQAKRAAIPVDPLAPGDSTFMVLEPYPYLIGPGDELRVDYGLVLDSRPITATVVVRPDGVVSLPRIGDVRAAGRSTAEMDSVLADLYADVYLNPSITVEVSRVAGNLVHVLGEVSTPGSYALMPNGSALGAIAQAGGFKPGASQGDVLVLRRMGMNKIALQRINMRQLLAGGKASGDMLLRRNDIVYVNRSVIGDIKLFSDYVLSPLLTAGQTYIHGWYMFHLDDVYTPGRTVARP
jgi:polysaccharide export outer membrane protein